MYTYSIFIEIILAYAIVNYTTLSQHGGRGRGHGGRHHPRICLVKNLTSGEECTAKCPSSKPCTSPPADTWPGHREGQRPADLEVKFCLPQVGTKPRS